MNENVDIFICTHKDFQIPVENEVYKIIDSRIIDKTKYKLSDDFYSEFLSFFHIADNFEIKDYIGFCHYRRYFSFLNDVPDINEIFKEYDLITVAPSKTKKESIREHYYNCHNIEDLEIIEKIVKEKYPEYYNVMEDFFNGTDMITNNMFIMKKDDFFEYISFIRNILNEYLKIVGTDIYKRIEDNKDKYIKNFSPNDTALYQYRIGGFLGERLTNIFIFKKFKNVKCYNYYVTEDKYNEYKTEEDGQ